MSLRLLDTPELVPTPTLEQQSWITSWTDQLNKVRNKKMTVPELIKWAVDKGDNALMVREGRIKRADKRREHIADETWVTIAAEPDCLCKEDMSSEAIQAMAAVLARFKSRGLQGKNAYVQWEATSSQVGTISFHLKGLRHWMQHDKILLAEPPAKGKKKSQRKAGKIRAKIKGKRKK